MLQHRNLKPYHCLGRSPPGDLTWWAHSRNLQKEAEHNYVSRSNNTEADELANIGSTRGPEPPGVFVESISQRSIKIKPAAPEAVAEADDASELAQVAAASPADDTSSQAVEGT